MLLLYDYYFYVISFLMGLWTTRVPFTSLPPTGSHRPRHIKAMIALSLELAGFLHLLIWLNGAASVRDTMLQQGMFFLVCCPYSHGNKTGKKVAKWKVKNRVLRGSTLRLHIYTSAVLCQGEAKRRASLELLADASLRKYNWTETWMTRRTRQAQSGRC